MNSQTKLVNPLARERVALHLTQQELAAQVGVTRNFIVRAENAEYPHPPKPLLEFFTGGDRLAYEALGHLYSAYQKQSRQDNYGLLYPDTKWLNYNKTDLIDPLTHPLTWWIIVTSQHEEQENGISNVGVSGAPTVYEICKAFCVHHATIHHWTTDAKTVKKVPKVFLAALFESGYNESVLIELEGAYELYRKHLLG